MIITIDGPTASGKSTIAKELAQRLGWNCLSSGFLFRALAYILTHSFGYSPQQIEDIELADIQEAFGNRFSYMLNNAGGVAKFDGKEITQFLKEAKLDQLASIIAKNEDVRLAVAQLQRLLVRNENVVVEGRDCGSVVFPDALGKFFLTAQVEVRAHRWSKDQIARGNPVEIELVKRMIEERDQRDSSRQIAPLVVPEGAYIIDSSQSTPNEIVAQMNDVVQVLIKKAPHKNEY
ncbi:MAG TPA: (d)CMP kinase [Candidatus Babeliales bacterium]|nr:(d)CMP kinase [Candidatus Babeliales bacterium]